MKIILKRHSKGIYYFKDNPDFELVKCDSAGNYGADANNEVWWDVFYKGDYIDGSYESYAEAKTTLTNMTLEEYLDGYRESNYVNLRGKTQRVNDNGSGQSFAQALAKSTSTTLMA